ncbi:MAG: hypothetical protein KBF64_01425 [Anaerolineaceae bacterium]|nr:hypothetical protein [Anaerolineaceae bacterium]
MKKIIVFLIGFCLLALPMPVKADIAPPAEPPGANPKPGDESTQVRMTSESILIEILEDTSLESLYVATATADQESETLGLAKVSASFNMRNLGKLPESMAVRFPVGTDDGSGNIVELRDMKIAVDGMPVNLRRIMAEDPMKMVPQVPWVEFDVLFPVQTDVVIKVQYILEATGEMPYIRFDYVFSTGAAWKGTIGNAELTVRFPYKVNILNYIPGSEYGNVRYIPGGIRCENQINWVFTNFEPDDEDNFSITLAAPSVWQKILLEQNRVKANPNDSEAWGRLGKLYKSLVMSSHGGRGFRDYVLVGDPGVQELYDLGVAAYENAVTLAPDDALWHAGYAELLGFYAYHAKYEGVDTAPITIRALEEIKRALELDSENETVRDIEYTLEFYFPQGIVSDNGVYDFPWLTRTPQWATATLISTDLPAAPSPTPEIINHTDTPMPSATPEVEQGERLPFCGAVFLAPVVLLLGLHLQRRKLR